MNKNFRNVMTPVLIGLAAGCSTRQGIVESRTRDHGGIRDGATALAGPAAESLPEIKTGEELTLQSALVLALAGNPGLEAFSHEVRAWDAHLIQAALLPNPELELEVESIDRDGQGSESAEPSVVLSQVIELGGKRAARRRVARAEGDLAAVRYESKRLEVLTRTAQAFSRVLAAQRRLELAESVRELSEELGRAVEARVQTGKESPVRLARAAAESEMAALAVQSAANALESARYGLASLWGGDEVLFKRVSGSLEDFPEKIPDLGRFREHLGSNPGIAASMAAEKLAEENLKRQRTLTYPDLTVAAGVQHFEEDDTQALKMGVGFPLPLFDRNQGNIAAARHELEMRRAQYREVSAVAASELVEEHARLVSAHMQAKVMNTKILPAVRGAYEAVREGYEHGKFDLLEVLDARRSLLEAEAKVIDALLECHNALSAIQGVLGSGYSDLFEERTGEDE